MIHNTWTLPNSVIQSKSPKNAHSEKIVNPSRGISFKIRVKSTVHFQIKVREWRSIHWWINSRIDTRPGVENEIDGGANFSGREFYVEEERIWEGGRRTGTHEGVLKEGRQRSWCPITPVGH
jgi:hypothetical protein